MMRHLLDIADLTRADLEGILDDADGFVDVLARPIPKVPALRGKTVTTAFFEASTRTRLSFERAAKTLSADTMTFAPGTSSLSKGESLKDTVLTLQAMGSDLLVMRHQAVGAAQRAAEWLSIPVVNGGDGAHQHPTQALLDALTIRRRFGRLDGLQIAIVGDIRHSRVARSDLLAFAMLGAEVTLVAPRTLLPVTTEGWPVRVSRLPGRGAPEPRRGLPAAGADGAGRGQRVPFSGRVHRPLRHDAGAASPPEAGGGGDAPGPHEPGGGDRRRGGGRPRRPGARTGEHGGGGAHGGALPPAGR